MTNLDETSDSFCDELHSVIVVKADKFVILSELKERVQDVS